MVSLYFMKMTQVKFIVNNELAKRFKQTVLAKRGKMETSREDEEALKLYLEKNKDFAPPESSEKSSSKSDSLIEVIGAVRTKKRSALDDVKMLESSDI